MKSICPIRERIHLMAEHQAAEKLRQWQRNFGDEASRNSPTRVHHVPPTSSAPWIVLKKGARVERVPKYNPKATNHKAEGNPVIQYSL